ncbi:hypothetical protein NOR_07997 [Metarhizium rileyi]|uniref:AA1-like domain-containing protein n=1 Tax=Metarhizium rileyi (strain RCEF 4871) TaxID=1649241 RepID=A0A166X4D2_METRR|nr:hypothetical protein NOR_07997 [Metarhizium rileyi RCEF 4871]
MHISPSVTLTLTLALAGQALSRAADKVCTVETVNAFVWRITGFEYRSEQYQDHVSKVAYGLANFTLENSALSYRTRCTALSTRAPDFFTGDTAYRCAARPDAPSDVSSFSFDRSTGLVAINQTWVCDKDGSRYAGRGEVRLALSCNQNQQISQSAGGGNSDKRIVCKRVDAPLNMTYMEAVA